MEFPCQACAFRDPVIKPGVDLRADLAQAPTMGYPNKPAPGTNTERHEPRRLKEGRRNVDYRDRAGLVPDAIVVARNHVKAKLTRRKLRVVGGAACSGVLPAVVDTLQ